MNERTRNTAVGITAILGLVGLCTLLILFGYLPSLLDRGYPLKISFANASGLNIGSRIKLNGIDVGRVTKIDLQLTKKQGVLITAKIRKEIDLPANVQATVEDKLLGGTVAIGLSVPMPRPEDENKPIAPLPKDGSVVLEGTSPIPLTEFAKQIQEALREPMDKFGRLANNFDELSAEWTSVGKNVNGILHPLPPETADTTNAPGNLSTLISRLDLRIKEMKTTLAGVDTWVNDMQFKGDLKATVANTREATAALKVSTEKFNKFADSSRENVDQLAKKYVAVADDLSKVLDTTQKTIELAKSGKGTLGLLLNDPALYNNLNDATIRLNSAMTEIKLLVEKWKQEGLQIF
jgi:phospholipid/cholesterol/gamma-HCH transport system substrate-binding protein